MGRTYLFECAKCGYRTQVAGGAERGYHVAVQTIQCLECRELRDAVTELKVPNNSMANLSHWKLKPGLSDDGHERGAPPSFPVALNRLAMDGGKHFRWVRFKPVCPLSPWHRTRIWKQPGKCPKCGVFLEGSGIPFKIWD